MSVIYLAGTENNSKWREAFITEIAKKISEDTKQNADLVFNTICPFFVFPTENKDLDRLNRGKVKHIIHVLSPRMTGIMNIYELTYDAMKRSKKMSFCILKVDFDDKQSIVFDQAYLDSLKSMGTALGLESIARFENFSDMVKYYYPIVLQLMNKGNKK